MSSGTGTQLNNETPVHKCTYTCMYRVFKKEFCVYIHTYILQNGLLSYCNTPEPTSAMNLRLRVFSS